MGDWSEVLRLWLAAHEGPAGYTVLAISSFAEYIVPPLPGDTVALLGIFLAASSGWSPLGVYLALDVGAVLGGLVAYAFGRAMADGRRRPAFLRGPRIDAALAVLTARYAARGAVYLTLNRFVPALRSLFFVAAGLARLPWPQVALWGAVSACVWNALLLGVGFGLGSGWRQLQTATQLYGGVVLVVGLVVLLVVGWRAIRARRAPHS